MIHAIAPVEKIGVIVDSSSSGGPVYICEIKDTCPVTGQMHLDDKIVTMDDEDVQRMTAANVSKMLSRQSQNAERKITVLREVDSGDGEDVDDIDMNAEETRTHNYEEGSTINTDALSIILPMTENPTIQKQK